MSVLKESLFNINTWLKILFILLFWFLLTLVGWVVGAVVIVQAVIVLITGERNMQLIDFARNLSTYLKQIIDYVCFVKEEKPFPFTDFPKN